MLARGYVNQDNNNIDLPMYSENILVSRDSNGMSSEESAMFCSILPYTPHIGQKHSTFQHTKKPKRLF